jgi:hypothetical protein
VVPEKIYYISGGADAWQADDLPWKQAGSFSLPAISLSGVKDLGENIGKLADDLKVRLCACVRVCVGGVGGGDGEGGLAGCSIYVWRG